MPKNQKAWDTLAPESKENGISEWKTIEQIINGNLDWGNNGNQRHGKFFHLTKYIWEAERVSGPRSKVLRLRTVGYDPVYDKSQLLAHRPIAPKIKQHFKGLCCVACGRNERMVIDHKNDLYNDPRVHNTKTQEIGDFQALCNNCNLKKRADCIKTKEQKRRQPGPYQCIQTGAQAFIEGGVTFDPEGLGMKGTYWYDVVEYYKYNKNLMLIEKKN